MIPSSHDFWWETGPDKGCTHLSQGWFDFTKTTWEENQGFGWAKVIYGGDVPLVQKRYGRAWRSGEPFRCDYRLRHWSGKYYWVIGQGKPIFQASEEGAEEVVGFSGFADLDYNSIVDPAAMLPMAESVMDQLFDGIEIGMKVVSVHQPFYIDRDRKARKALQEK